MPWPRHKEAGGGFQEGRQAAEGVKEHSESILHSAKEMASSVVGKVRSVHATTHVWYSKE